MSNRALHQQLYKRVVTDTFTLYLSHYRRHLPQTYSETCVNGHTQKDRIGFQDLLLLNAGQKYCRIIMQYFQPSLSYHLSFIISLICLF